jgi:molybdopterin molybdotransferase
MRSGSHRIGFAKARRIISRTSRTLEAEQVPALEACGRILRQDVVNRSDYPTGTVSSVDGYCLRAASTLNATVSAPAMLAVRATIAAGWSRLEGLGEGECAKIMTGAVLPPGTDAVVRLEETELINSTVAIRHPVAAGSLVRRQGEISRAGEVIIEQGELVTARHLAALATLGCGPISVSRQPKVGLLVTGDEIIGQDDVPYPGCVRSSNAVMLSGLLMDQGIQIQDGGTSPDRRNDVVRALEHLSGNDVVIVSGGSALGDRDLVASALEVIGAKVVLRGLRMRPGRHMMVAQRGGCTFFCLPGSPVACFILFHLAILPALRSMMGCRKPYPVAARAKWAGATLLTTSDMMIILASMRPDLAVEPVEYRGAGDVLSIARADSLVAVPENVLRVAHGQTVDVFRVGTL